MAVNLLHGTAYSAGASNIVQFVLPARPVRFAQWQAHHFDSAQLADLLISSPDATPARDDIPNLVKYAFSLNPWKSRSWANFPMPELRDERLTLVYTRSKWISDLNFRPEVSGDLVTWSSDPAEVEMLEVLDLGDYERVTARDRSSAAEGLPRFMRLSVALVP